LVYWDLETVEKEYQIFKQLNPSNIEDYSYFVQYLWAVGRFREAFKICKDDFNRDETSEGAWVFMALTYLYIGEYEKALETIETTLRLFPQEGTVYRYGDYILRNALLIYVGTARYDDAIKLFEKNSTGRDLNNFVDEIIGYMGIAYFKTGNERKSTMFLNELLSRNSNFFRNGSSESAASVYVAMGKNEKALQLLEKAYSNRELHLVMLKTFPLFRSLHGDPRFEDLLVRIGFK